MAGSPTHPLAPSSAGRSTTADGRRRVDIERLRALAASGKIKADAARAFGVTTGAICMAAKRHGIAFQRRPSRTKRRPPSWQELAAQGKTREEAAAARNCLPSSARKAARHLGLTFAPPPGTPLSWEECARQGMTRKQAADARGLTVGAADDYARRTGLAFTPGRAGRATPEARP